MMRRTERRGTGPRIPGRCRAVAGLLRRRAGTAARASIVAAALLGGAGGARGQAVIGGDWRADVDSFAARVVAAGLTPGLALGVATGGHVAHARGFGTTDLATGRPVDGDTPFYIASSTKSFTALAVVLAAARGDIDLDASILRYLPTARFAEGVEPKAITVRDLLSMTHGLSGEGPITLVTAYTGQFDPADLPAMLRFHKPTGHKGTFDYDNLGYNVLGMILDARYGASWKDVVRKEVLAPIGMSHTSAYWSRIDHARVAYPHAATTTGFARLPVEKKDANLHAAGGHYASARDLARYLAAHISGGVVEGERVLPRAPLLSTHEMRVAQDAEFGPFHRYGWGYGWDLGTFEGDTILHRFGSFGGYRSHMSFMPSHDIGVVVLTNGGGPASPAADLVATYIYDRMLGKPDVEARYAARLDSLEAMAAAYRQRLGQQLAQRKARLAPLQHPLADYAGVYESALLGRMRWRVVAGGLEMTLGVIHSRAEVFDAAHDALRVEAGGSGLVAAFAFPSDGGPASAIRLAGNEFKRVAAEPR